MSTPLYLVVGATGRQGGATVSALLHKAAPSSIRALTRNTQSPAAQKLASKGISVVQGDLSDPASLSTALKGVSSLHLVTDYKASGVEAEVLQASYLIEAAKAQGVKHIVFSSVDGASSDTLVLHWKSKHTIEEMVKASGIHWTILRPACFMDNFPPTPGFLRFLMLGMFDSGTDSKPLQLVATENIGFFAADALLNFDEYDGVELAIAGDEITVPQMAKVYGIVQGPKARKLCIPSSLLYAVLPDTYAGMLKVCSVLFFDDIVPHLSFFSMLVINAARPTFPI